MGEIADALKQAKAEQESASPDSRTSTEKVLRENEKARKAIAATARPPSPPSRSSEGTYTAALEAAANEIEANRAADREAESDDSDLPPAASATSEFTDAFGPSHDLPERQVELELSGESGIHSEARAVLVDEKGPTAEAFRHFALRVNREAAAFGKRAIVITSPLRGEGKTTTACNLALAMSSIAGGRSTALVDLDLRRPALARYLGTHHPVGIDAVLNRKADLDQARVTTNFPLLDLFPVVRATPQPHELLSSEALPEMIEKLCDRYHTVIIDSPPVLLVPDVEILLPSVGGYVVVIRSRKTRVDAVQQLLELLPREKMLGCFLNEARRTKHSKQYGNYYKLDDSQIEEER